MFTSCSPAPDTTTQARIDELQKRIEAQQVEIASFEKTTLSSLENKSDLINQSLTSSFSNLNASVNLDIANLKQSVYGQKSAILDPSDKGYSYINTDKGVFLFTIDGADTFLDGHKIILRIGNPMNMTFSGFKLRVVYGRRPPEMPSTDISKTYDENRATSQKWWEDRRAWAKTVRTKDITFTDTLESGAWNKVNFILPDTKPEDVAYIDVSIFTDQVSLRKPSSDLK